MKDFNFWHFAAGLALFLFGMFRVEAALKELAGRPFKKFLQKHTRHPLKAVMAGTFVTAILQSSSVVLLMILSFVGAGIMGMQNALAVVLGSNLGTTLSSWVVALVGFKLDIVGITYPILTFALVGLIFFRHRSGIRAFSEFLIGFSLLFIGLEWMKVSASTLADPDLLSGLTNKTPYLFIPIGFVITVLIQSSSATMAIVLTALYQGLIPLEHGAAIVIGSELGTGMKLLVSAIGGIPDKKRVALGNFYFNAITLLISSLLLYPFLNLIGFVLDETEPLIKLVVFQTGINLLSILIFLPILKHFAAFLGRKYTGIEKDDLSLFIHKASVYPGKDSLELAEMEIVSLLRNAFLLNRMALEIETENESMDSWYKNFRKMTQPAVSYNVQYQRIKLLQGEILDYVQEIQQEKFTREQISRTNMLLHICREVIHGVKNVKDIKHNLNELADSADDELYSLYMDLQKREKLFYAQLEIFLAEGGNTKATRDKLDDFLKMNKEEHEGEISKLFLLLRGHKISEFEVSTLLNVYREIYSSHKAFLLALSDLFNGNEEH